MLERGDEDDPDTVKLSTLHASKGLEYPHVYLVGVEEGLLPHMGRDEEDGDPAKAAESLATRIQEERRLMYVAITRARKRLFMTFSQTRMLHGQTRYNMRSRFFDELPEQSIKWLSPKIAQHHWFANPKSAWDEVPEAGNNKIAQSFSRQTDSGWRIGQNVAHAKFGEGVIVNIEGGGGAARAQINFGKFGMKLLDLSVAKLDKI